MPRQVRLAGEETRAGPGERIVRQENREVGRGRIAEGVE